MRASDSLWPVLLLTTLVLGSGSALEVYARSREAGAIEIVVAAEAASPASSSDADAAEADAPDDAAPISEQHALARSLARRGDIDEALRLFDKVAAEQPQAPGPKLDLGYWQRRAGKLKDSLVTLVAAEALAPTSVSAAFQLATSQLASGNVQAAEQGYRRALQLGPNHSPAMLALGRLLKKRGDTKEALSLLKRASGQGSNNERANALLALGKLQVSTGQTEQGLAAFKAAIERAPSDPGIRLEIAKACLASGQKGLYPEALAQAERAARLAPDRALVVGLLGWVRERVGDRDGARSSYQLALQIDPSQDYAERKLLRLDLAAQDLRSARRHAEHLLAQFPSEPEHHFLRALVASREGNLDEARKLYQAAIEQAKGNYPEAYFNLGRLEKSADDLRAAAARYRKALELKPDYVEALNNLGLVLLASGEAADAKAQWQEALRLDARYAPAWVNLAELAATEHAFSDADASFQKALEVKPRLASALLGLARSRRDAGRIADSVADYQALLTAQPRQARAWFELSELLERQGNLRAAADAAQKAHSLTPDDEQFLFKSADMLAKVGDFSAARTAFEELLDRSPGHGEARLGLAELLLKLGDATGCEREASRVIDSATGQARARALLVRCSKS